MQSVNPEILVWARKTAGMNLEEAVLKLGLTDARGLSAATRLEMLESGVDAPTTAMLLKMAKQYRRSLLTFYLPTPPRKGDRGEDFRMLPLQDRTLAGEALLDALIRDVRARQSLVRSVLEDDEDIKPLGFVGSIAPSEGIAVALKKIQQVMGISLADFRAKKTHEEAFALLRSGAEAAGIFVLLIGNLGSHHTTFDVKAFRGFAVADQIAPFVVINDQDAKSAWSFTLLHEVVHLLIGATGISGTSTEASVERFCNEVASEFLLPSEELRDFARDQEIDLSQIEELISAYSSERNLSRSLVAYKFYRVGLIAESVWRTASANFREQWIKERAIKRDRASDSNGGPNYYVVRRHRLGTALLDMVRRTMSDGALTPTKAGKVLGVKPRNVEPLLSDHRHAA